MTEKKITIVEITVKDGEQTRVEAPKPKVKVAALGITPEDVERKIKEKQQEKKP